MNVSMMDTFNLGWKLASVIKGLSLPGILSTYESERRDVALELIEFDRKLVPLMSGKPEVSEKAGVSQNEFSKLWRSYMKWTTGTAVVYPSSVFVRKPASSTNDKQATSPLAKNIVVGSHLESYRVVCVADAHPWHLCDRLTSDGRWRLIIFPGFISNATSRARLSSLASYLASPSGPIKLYTPRGENVNGLIEVLTVIADNRNEVELEDWEGWAGQEGDGVLRPRVGQHGFRVTDTILSDSPSYHDPPGNAYENYGISKEEGCVVVVRPDQYVAMVVGLEETKEIGEFFEGVFIPVPAYA